MNIWCEAVTVMNVYRIPFRFSNRTRGTRWPLDGGMLVDWRKRLIYWLRNSKNLYRNGHALEEVYGCENSNFSFSNVIDFCFEFTSFC